MADTTAIDSGTLDIFERSVRGVFAQPGVDVGHALHEIGWFDFLVADPASVVPLMFGLLGQLGLASGALEDVAFAVLGAAGEELRTSGHAFAHPRGVGSAATSTSEEITVDALVLGGRRDVPVALVMDERVVTIAAAALAWVPVTGIDPELGLARVRGVIAKGDAEVHRDVDGTAVAPACRRALAHELLGATDAMLATATDYAKVRTQFGQPIGAFQAVKHRLADVYVARQAASAVIDESWRSDPDCTTLAAKALAGTAATLASENCLQVLGAIGFTLEHDLHRFVRRVKVLDRLYGSNHELRTALGRLLGARRRVPRPGSA